MKRFFCLTVLLVAIFVIACKNNKDKQATLNAEVVQEIYTCPMPEDSVFSDKAGVCSKCGMDLVKKEIGRSKNEETELNIMLSARNEFVDSKIPVIAMNNAKIQIEVDAFGKVEYDTRKASTVSSRVAGRIVNLYVRYRFQKIEIGQLLYDIYSPELMTAQQNLLLLLKDDSSNTSFLDIAKEKLAQLGMSKLQIQRLIQTGEPNLVVSVYSNFRGHIHESMNSSNMISQKNPMKVNESVNELLTVKEGIYLEKGQSVFSVYNPDRVWAVLNILGDKQNFVQLNNSVKLISETAPDESFKGIVDFIEPFYRNESKTSTIRVFFNNSKFKIPIGSQISATIFGTTKISNWLPMESVLSIGLDKVVYVKSGNGFVAQKIKPGVSYKNSIEILSGLSTSDSVALNAQYLMDSESFIKLKK